MSRYTVQLTVKCPFPTEGGMCACPIEVALNVCHDPGCWRTPNGDGWPESWDFEATHAEECPECHTPLVGEVWEKAVDEAFSDHEPPSREGYY